MSFQALIDGEVLGNPVEMKGHPVVAAETFFDVEGKLGAVVDESDEERALKRWSDQIFDDAERSQGAMLRKRAKSDKSLEQLVRIFSHSRKRDALYPETLDQVVAAVDTFLDAPGYQFRTLKFGLSQFEQPAKSKKHVAKMWVKYRRPPIKHFLPYLHFCLRLALTLRYAVALNLIGQKPTNLIDLEYLFYLPFCRIFVSADKLHHELAPLFLRSDQRYFDIEKLRPGLREIASYYAANEDELKKQGSMKFAAYPPLSLQTTIHEIYDQMVSGWRYDAANPHDEMTPEEKEQIFKEMKPQIEAMERALARKRNREG